jgi:hypothetical protein
MASAVKRRQYIGDQQRDQEDQDQGFEDAQDRSFLLRRKTGGVRDQALLSRSQFQRFSSGFMTQLALSRN